ncbi:MULTISPECIES: flavin reductase family protein [Actinoplanes]|uniref:flavin reductase family protein n=1 Tax=Actinoplanes TaxID=1865 RepID=UPI0005F2C153|nr:MULTISPECIES: flavin reductase family protein [Actinoplanes]GLY07725.1 flavin oxidoreductase [Actinoplanes sp. NBRC 101535]
MEHSSDRFKAAFRRYPTGVAVVSAPGPVGLTVSSVSSVSADPPALSFSVLDSPSGRAIVGAPSLVVNLLGTDHADLAGDFARSGGPRFTPEQGWSTLPTGEPFLAGALASLRVEPLHQVRVGGSTVIVAAVTEVLLGPVSGRLVHHDRQFITTHSEGH